MQNLSFRLLNAIFLAAVLAVNWLATTLPLNGMTPKEISDQFAVQLTPASYAFSIWGIIYLFLILYIVVQLWPGKRDAPEVKATNPWFLFTCVFNIGWLFLWHYLYTTLSLLAMLGLLVSLIFIYRGIRRSGWSTDWVIRWFVQMPFSIYIGWITAASILNTTIVLSVNGMDGFGWSTATWTVLVVVLVTLLALIIGSTYHDPAYALTIAWAIAAIGVANKTNAAISYTAWSSAALLALFAVWLLLPRGRSRFS